MNVKCIEHIIWTIYPQYPKHHIFLILHEKILLFSIRRVGEARHTRQTPVEGITFLLERLHAVVAFSFHHFDSRARRATHRPVPAVLWLDEGCKVYKGYSCRVSYLYYGTQQQSLWWYHAYDKGNI